MSTICEQIAASAKKAAVKQYLKKECTPIDKKFPWSEQEYECPTKPTDKT